MTTNRQIKLMGITIDSFDSYDVDSIITNFWMHSVTNRMNEFNFIEAFKSLKDPIHRKLSEHGLTTLEDFQEFEEGIYDYSNLSNLTQQTSYINIDEDDLKNALIEYKFNRNKKEFSGYSAFKELQEILDDIDNHYGHTLQWKIELFDRVIHAQHETGDIFENVNIDDLREDAEEEIKELLNL